MTNYRFGDVVLVRFPNVGTQTSKQRPALVILDVGDADLVLAPVTSQPRRGNGDLKLDGWKAAGLVKESWVRLAKVVTLSISDVQRLSGNDTSVQEVHPQILQITQIGTFALNLRNL
jgi:mRNA interferase MazF